MVRVVGAVETKNIAPRRAPLYAAMTVNDGPTARNTSIACGSALWTRFYSVAEFYFHAPAKRAYTAKLWVDEGSAVDLLVHSIDLHDVLAGTTRRAVKTSMTLSTPETRDG